MDFATILTDPDPSTLPGLFAWLLTQVGYSTVAVALTALGIWVWRKRTGAELSDTAKKVLAVAFSGLVVALAYSGRALLGYGDWSLEGLYEQVFSAVMVALLGQGVYQFGWKPIGDWLQRLMLMPAS